MNKTCLCLFSKSHLCTTRDASIAPVSAGENVLPLSSIRPCNYSSQRKQGKASDSSPLKFDWTKYFQIFCRKQSCSSQALMSVISIICFSIQLQLKAAKFFLSHYGTKWLLNYVMGFFIFKKENERNQHLLAISSYSHTATLIITATTQRELSLTTSNLITVIKRHRTQHAKPSSGKSINSYVTSKK